MDDRIRRPAARGPQPAHRTESHFGRQRRRGNGTRRCSYDPASQRLSNVPFNVSYESTIQMSAFYAT